MEPNTFPPAPKDDSGNDPLAGAHQPAAPLSPGEPPTSILPAGGAANQPPYQPGFSQPGYPPYPPPPPPYPTYPGAGQPLYAPPNQPPNGQAFEAPTLPAASVYGQAEYGTPTQPLPPIGVTPRPRRQLKTWQWAVAGVSALLVVCCLAGTVAAAIGGNFGGRSSAVLFSPTATDTQNTSPQATDTPADIPTDTPIQPTDTPVQVVAPQPTDTPSTPIQYGWYQVTLNGVAGVNSFTWPAALLVMPGVYQHAVDICLATGSLISPETQQAPGVIYFESNSACMASFGGAGGAGATASYDDGFVKTLMQAGSVEVDPDPTHCCNMNNDPDQFDITSDPYTSNPVARGSVILQFNSDGSVLGKVSLASCTDNPYCADATAVFYTATLSGNFDHS